MFNYNSGSILELDGPALYFYRNLDNIFELEQGNNYYDILNENSMIVPVYVDETQTLDFLLNCAKFSEKVLSLTIAPTLDCNMRCPYCYEESNNVTNVSMTEDVMKNILDFIKKRINHLELLYIVWYGGEPLLEKEKIIALSIDIVNICKDNNVKYYSSIITNGTLLDYNTSLELKNTCNITNCQITIDGTREINDRRRIMRDGSGSFDKIVKNINDCKDILDIMIRVNVDKDNLENIPDLVDLFSKIYDWNEKVNYYFAKVDNYSLEQQCNQHNLINDKDLLRAITKVNYTANSMKKYQSLDYLLSSRISYCGATNYNNYVFDPKGLIYKCLATIGIENVSIGSLDGGIDIYKHMKWVTHSLDKKCNKCIKRPICQGGCPLRMIESNQEHSCKFDYNKFEAALNDYYDNIVNV